MAPCLPPARGPLTTALFEHWLDRRPLRRPDLHGRDVLVDDDLHLALWCCYEQHHHGFEGLSDRWEWDTETLAFRAALEDAFEAALRAEHDPSALPADPVDALQEVTTWAGPPLSRRIADTGTRDQLTEFAIHRSAYQLKEADGHTWGLPRLAGPGRSAMLEIQADEYGGGVPGEAHAELFAEAMGQLGLSSKLGAYVPVLPGSTLATDNLVELFGLNRRLRGALVGHLALFEMTSVTPMSRYRDAARRLGDVPALERFYDVHVEVDVHHADLALNRLVAETARSQPSLAADIVFGAAALSRVEARFAGAVLAAWDAGRSSLLAPAAPSLGAAAA